MKRVLVYFEPPFVHKGNTENFWGVVGADIGHTWIFQNVPTIRCFILRQVLFMQVLEIGFGWHFSGGYYMKSLYFTYFT